MHSSARRAHNQLADGMLLVAVNRFLSLAGTADYCAMVSPIGGPEVLWVLTRGHGWS
jgi:hypothetical protein